MSLRHHPLVRGLSASLSGAILSGSVVVGCASSSGGTSMSDVQSTTGSDSSSPKDDSGTDGSDGSDGVDAADVSDGTDGTDGVDGTEGADGTAAECANHAECDDAAKPFCDSDAGKCVAPPPGSAIGWGAGTTVTMPVVYEPSRAYQGTSLDFHPERDELWVALREFPTDEPCEQFQATQAGCQELEGSVAVITGAATETPKGKIMKDINAWHFMRRPTGLSFGEGDLFATCGEARTGNYEDDTADFMGPTLWSADPEIFAQDPGAGLNGSHMDMLHLTPFCMGIEHEVNNVYWTFNGQVGAIERYDFAEDHGPGHEDHSDGTLQRFIVGQVKRVEDVPSHLAYDAATGFVYIADTGNARVLRLDPSTAKPAQKLPAYEAMVDSREYDGADLVEIVPPGRVAVPSGLVLHGGALYVSDPSTSRIYAFDLQGKLLNELDTGLEPGALSGMTIHAASGALFFTEMTEGRVFRVAVTR